MRRLFRAVAAVSFTSLITNGAAAMPVAPAASFDQIIIMQNVRFLCDVYGGCWRIEPRYPVVYGYYNDRAYAPSYSKGPAYVYGWGGPGVGMVRLRLSSGVPF